MMKYLTLTLLLIGTLTLSACGTNNNSASSVESTQPTEEITAAPIPSIGPTATEVDSGSVAEITSTPSVTEAATSKPSSTPTNTTTETPSAPPTKSPSKSPSPVKTGSGGKDAPAKATAKTTAKATAKATEKPVHTEHVVEIINFGFSPAKLEIKVGDTVKFVNRDEIRHSATAEDKSFNSELLGKDESKTFTFDKQGEYSYFCIPHPGMKGSINVNAE